MTVDLSNNTVNIHDNHSENWKVTMVDTGLHTQTGGRLKRIQKYIGNERFLLTYGDGVSDINIAESIKAHEASGCAVSLTAYKPGGKFGACRSIWKVTRSCPFRRNRTVTATGSMPAISCASRKCSTIYRKMMTRWYLSASLWNNWQKTVRCTPTAIQDSGSRWIPCETIRNWMRCGTKELLLGKFGDKVVDCLYNQK